MLKDTKTVKYKCLCNILFHIYKTSLIYATRTITSKTWKQLSMPSIWALALQSQHGCPSVRLECLVGKTTKQICNNSLVKCCKSDSTIQQLQFNSIRKNNIYFICLITIIQIINNILNYKSEKLKMVSTNK